MKTLWLSYGFIYLLVLRDGWALSVSVIFDEPAAKLFRDIFLICYYL